MQDEEDRRSPGTGSPTGSEASAGRRAVTELLGDRYEIVGKLAGAFGEVYEAMDTSLGRRVAIKRIRLDSVVLPEGASLDLRLRSPLTVTVEAASK